jgi:membrane protease YdiL (CAAX protease family)
MAEVIPAHDPAPRPPVTAHLGQQGFLDPDHCPQRPLTLGQTVTQGTPSRLRRFFLHPLVRLGISLLGVLALLLLLSILTAGVTMPMGGLGRQLLTSILTSVAALAAMLGVGRYLERQGPSQLGFGLPGIGRHWAWGMVLGTALMSAVAAVLTVTGWIQWDAGPPDTVRQHGREMLVWLAIFLFAGLFEEVVFRGIFFRLIEEWLGSGVALLVSGALFGLVHMNNENGSGLSAMAIAVEAGVLLGACYMLTRSLWFPIGVHIAWNCTQGVLLGLAVSGGTVHGVFMGRMVGPEFWTGGSFGPEAGAVSIVLSTLAGVVLVVAARRRGQWRPLALRRASSEAVSEPGAR